MKALITGASSGIGCEMAKYLSSLGYDLILVARRKERLIELKDELNTKVKIIVLDLSSEEACIDLYQSVTDEKIDILVNNAGFGLLGEFAETSLAKELEMIDINIRTVHILTKLFLKDMRNRNKGYILNVSSLAAFQAGPLMSTYYATKAYVLRITLALYEELRRDNSSVVISVLCPGPVETDFNKVAGVSSTIKSVSSQYVAKYAIDKMFKKKLIIIPGLKMKMSYYFSKLLSVNKLLKVTYFIQNKKRK